MREITVRSWWVWLFVLISYAIYDYATDKLASKQERLETLSSERRTQLAFELERRTHLEQQIQSQSDPAYIELILMRELGVVPDGQRKVYFD